MSPGNMEYLNNDTASFYYTGALLPYIVKLCLLSKEHPFIFEHIKGINDKEKEIFRRQGFDFYPTVKNTTLLYNQQADCFFKILHPLTVKNKILFFLLDKAGHIYTLSELLSKQGIKLPIVEAYGAIGKNRRPFFVIKKVKGKSLYDILIRERKSLTMKIYLKVMDEVARLHLLGYWFGDAHLSHIFVTDSGVSGFIDIDSIRKNRPFSIRSLAKDLAGLNHPELPFIGDERKALIDYYLDKLNIKREKKFLRLLKYYSERRWKA